MEVTIKHTLLLKLNHLSKPGIRVLTYLLSIQNPNESYVVLTFKAFTTWADKYRLDQMHRSDFSKALTSLMEERIIEKTDAVGLYKPSMSLFVSTNQVQTKAASQERDVDL